MAGWAGGLLGVAGLAVGLVAWVGLDRANAYLGVPAAVAALVGLGVSVYALVGSPAGDGDASSGRRVRQRATATDRAHVMQVGGSVVGGTGPRSAAGLGGRVDQRASAAGEASVEQVAGNRPK